VVLLVVREERRRPLLRLPVERIAHFALDRHFDGLVHLVADDHASDGCLRRHRYTVSFSRSTVFTRARSRRSDLSLWAASICPIDFWIRRRNSWSSRSFSRCFSSSVPRSRNSPIFIPPSPQRTASRTSSGWGPSRRPDASPRALPARSRPPSRTGSVPGGRRTPTARARPSPCPFAFPAASW